jgi:Protein of unknown function (DUF445)
MQAVSNCLASALPNSNGRVFFALTLLVMMTGVFGVTSALAASWPFLVYPRAFAEAAMVGACADWFAVVALFRHPLDLPIPHTAIVPRYKKRIGDALGRFISVNFLAPEEVAAKLEKIDAAGWISSWLKDPENTRLAAQALHTLLPPLLEFVRQKQIQTFSRGVILRGIDDSGQAVLKRKLRRSKCRHFSGEWANDCRRHRTAPNAHNGVRSSAYRCVRPAAMTPMGTPFIASELTQVWRKTWNVAGGSSFAVSEASASGRCWRLGANDFTHVLFPVLSGVRPRTARIFANTSGPALSGERRGGRMRPKTDGNLRNARLCARLLTITKQ